MLQKYEWKWERKQGHRTQREPGNCLHFVRPLSYNLCKCNSLRSSSLGKNTITRGMKPCLLGCLYNLLSSSPRGSDWSWIGAPGPFLRAQIPQPAGFHKAGKTEQLADAHDLAWGQAHESGDGTSASTQYSNRCPAEDAASSRQVKVG